MNSDAPLSHLIKQAAANPALEPQFLTALLRAPLYVHAPLANDSLVVRLVQFKRQDGLVVLPVFTDEIQAQRASAGAVTVICVPGRVLLESTLGATLMLDPNGRSTTLYPEEIALLLAEGWASTTPGQYSPSELLVGPAEEQDSWVGDIAVLAVGDIASVSAIYLLQASQQDRAPQDISLVVALCAPMADAERLARAVALGVQFSQRTARFAIDVMTFPPDEPPPSWLHSEGVNAFWMRSAA